jgi:hypothetical protein
VFEVGSLENVFYDVEKFLEEGWVHLIVVLDHHSYIGTLRLCSVRHCSEGYRFLLRGLPVNFEGGGFPVGLGVIVLMIVTDSGDKTSVVNII